MIEDIKKKSMATVAGLYGLSDDKRHHRRRNADRSGKEENTPDGLSEP